MVSLINHHHRNRLLPTTDTTSYEADRSSSSWVWSWGFHSASGVSGGTHTDCEALSNRDPLLRLLQDLWIHPRVALRGNQRTRTPQSVSPRPRRQRARNRDPCCDRHLVRFPFSRDFRMGEIFLASSSPHLSPTSRTPVKTSSSRLLLAA